MDAREGEKSLKNTSGKYTEPSGRKDYRPRYATKPWKALYSTKRWKAIRSQRLNEDPLCKYCMDRGKATPATIIDHINPHRGDEALFFNYLNTQSLCKACHDSVKQSFEKTGTMKGCNKDGMPIDIGHHWNTGGVDKN